MTLSYHGFRVTKRVFNSLPLLSSSFRSAIPTLSYSTKPESHTSHVVGDDGRRYEFATVALNQVTDVGSAKVVYDHATSLLQGPATAAIVYVSQPTKQARMVAAEISRLILQTGTCEKDAIPVIGCIAGDWTGFSFRTESRWAVNRGGMTGSDLIGPVRSRKGPLAIDEALELLEEVKKSSEMALNPEQQSQEELLSEIMAYNEVVNTLLDPESVPASDIESFGEDWMSLLKESQLFLDSKAQGSGFNLQPLGPSNFSSEVEEKYKGSNGFRPDKDPWLHAPKLTPNVSLANSSNGLQGIQSMAESEDSRRSSRFDGRFRVSDGSGSRAKFSGQSNSDSRVKDKNVSPFRIQLCVASLPGVKALSYYAKSSALPYFPGLEKAILDDNPHLIFFGAPGFDHLSHLQHLEAVFPEGSRAAVMFPHSVRMFFGSVGSESDMDPLFCGTNIEMSGAVGIAFNSEVGSKRFPLVAFAEFVKMSLSFPRLMGQFVFDDALSRQLFRPRLRNVDLFMPNSDSDSLLASPAGIVDGSAPSQSTTPEDDALPIAILGDVPFPGWSVPFQIFEPRYRLMVRQCVESNSPCGFAAPVTDSIVPYLIGTTGSIHVDEFDSDYKSRVSVYGRKRFKALPSELQIVEGSFGLFVSKVSYFDDEDPKSDVERKELRRLAKRACALCHRVVETSLNLGPQIGMRFLNPWLHHNPIAASFAIGHVLPVENDIKMRWLSSTDTKMRLLEQMHFMKTYALKKKSKN